MMSLENKQKSPDYAKKKHLNDVIQYLSAN